MTAMPPNLHFDFSQHPLRNGFAPAWADEWGQDAYGAWAAFVLSRQEQEIRQCLRWIPPGEFLMGSPPEEDGRFDNETQHPVSLSQGFWLFDTPVTQALWQAIMGNNSSRFQTPTRPVEQVSWDDCQGFLDKLSQQLAVSAKLPSEAQWEFACRAGTETATYAGDLDILGDANAPLLDDIAWYGGNSGMDFELDNGSDLSYLNNKQYPQQGKAGSHPVAQKKPNPWGLYDMLGNVWEWCEDYHGDYPQQAQSDPTGADSGTARVVRGGAWSSKARNARAANRFRLKPDYRYFYLGFRCALVQA